MKKFVNLLAIFFVRAGKRTLSLRCTERKKEANTKNYTDR